MRLPTRRNLLALSPAALLATQGFAQTELPAEPGRLAGSRSTGIFDVRSFGAEGDGKNVDSPAINRAIAAAASHGGGIVFVPAGQYLSFSIRLKSHVDLVLSPGAYIIAADSPLPGETTGYRGGTYDPAEPNPYEAYQDYGHNHWHNSLLWGEDIHDFSITGTGFIWGRGLSNSRNHTHLGYRFVAEQAGVGNKAIALKNCHNVTLRDFSILKGGHFGILLTGVDNITCDNLKIDTDRDGIDVDCCQNVRISRCTVNTPWDDGICPKSSYALGHARPTRNMTISDCFVTGSYEMGSVLDGTWRKFSKSAIGPYEVGVTRTGRVKCGTESNGGFINIAITNCVFEGCQGYALESVDGATIEDITISNTVMRDCIKAPIFVRLGARLRGPQPGTTVGQVRRIFISNLASYNSEADVCSVLSGIPEHPIEDVHLSDIFVESTGGGTDRDAAAPRPENEAGYPEPDMFGRTPACGFYLRHMRNVELSHIEVRTSAPDARPLLAAQNVERLDLFHLAGARGNRQPLAQLDQVEDFRMAWTRGVDDVHLAHVASRLFS